MSTRPKYLNAALEAHMQYSPIQVVIISAGAEMRRIDRPWEGQEAPLPDSMKRRLCAHLMGTILLATTGPQKQPRPMALNKRPSVVALSPRLCMLGNVLKRTYTPGVMTLETPVAATLLSV
jgi:hypothetical protein